MRWWRCSSTSSSHGEGPLHRADFVKNAIPSMDHVYYCVDIILLSCIFWILTFYPYFENIVILVPLSDSSFPVLPGPFAPFETATGFRGYSTWDHRSQSLLSFVLVYLQGSSFGRYQTTCRITTHDAPKSEVLYSDGMPKPLEIADSLCCTDSQNRPL